MVSSLTTVASFKYTHEAHVAKSKLEAHGIEAFVLDEQFVGMNWLNSNAVGGVRLQVPVSSAEEARSILDENQSKILGGWGSCPSCQSEDVELRIDRRWSHLTWLLLGIPLLFPKRTLYCVQCGNTWKLK